MNRKHKRAASAAPVRDSTVTLSSSATGSAIHLTERDGESFRAEVPVDNTTAPQYPEITVTAVKNNTDPLGPDAVATLTRRALVPKSPEVFTHDADGNLTADGQWSYSWDAENRLVGVETLPALVAPSGPLPLDRKRRVEYVYDAQHRRVARKAYAWNPGTSAWTATSDVRYLYDGWNVIVEFSFNSSTSVLGLSASYAWGLDLSGTREGAGGVGGLLFARLQSDAASVTHVAAADGNGNVLAYYDAATGERTARFEYGPFGEPLVDDGPAAEQLTYRFSTKFHDSLTDIYYYGLRYYSPRAGRWLSKDPMEEDGGINLFAFVENAPTEWFDPLGLALYAFDGTKNDGYRDKKKGNETNVFVLFEVYEGTNAAYMPGVGTNDGLLNPIGAAFGYGGQARERDMLAKAGEFIQRGDLVADIIGFSRGAAQARDFANKLKEKYPCVRIRWIGLFDTVASEGLPNNVNFGYKLGVPDDTGSVLHITAGAERRRKPFALSSIRPGPGLPNPNPNYREEEMVDAVHSDVGGFYGKNRGLANQALLRMWRDGRSNGVPFGPLPLRYSNLTPSGPNDSRWPTDRAIEALRGKKRIRKVYYHP